MRGGVTGTMSYFPICLDLAAKPCLVIGGGRVAERKAGTLCRYGAAVTVLSPACTARIEQWAATGRLTLCRRAYRAGDLEGYLLVVAATDDPAVQAAVHQEAAAKNILLNVADVPQRCSFILPAVVQRGALQVAVSTAGSSPALARRIRQDLEQRFGPEYGVYTAILGLLRPVVLAAGRSQEENRRQFEALLDDRMVGWIRTQQWDTIRDHLTATCREPIPPGVLAAIRRLVLAPPDAADTE